MAYLEEVAEGRPPLESVDDNVHRSRNASEVGVLEEDLHDASSEDEYFELSALEPTGPDSSDDNRETSENASVYTTASSGTLGSLASAKSSKDVWTSRSELADDLEPPPGTSALQSPHRSVFPTEICERMIDYCSAFVYYKYGYQTLKACALTCRAWRYRSQFHLFFRVVLENMKALKSFQTVIELHPSIRSYVYHLQVRFGYRVEAPIKCAIGSILITFHKKLPKLKSLALWDGSETSLHGSETSLHACTYMIARQYTSITHLVICGVLYDNFARVWFSLTNSFPSLSHLDMTRTGLFAIPETLWGYQHYLCKTKLIFLGVAISSANTSKSIDRFKSDVLAPYILVSPSATTLKKLWFEVDGLYPNAIYAQTLLSTCGSSICECTIDFMYRPSTFGSRELNESLLNFEFNINLNRLYLIGISSEYASMIHLLLSTISSNKVDTIILEILYDSVMQTCLSSIATLLSTLKFASLQRLVLCLGPVSLEQTEEMNEASVKECFSKQAASGILFVKQEYLCNDLRRDLGFYITN